MSEYKLYSPDEIEELLSNFLVTSWSYSKVTGFARNEKAFEMQYIYGLYSRSSSTTFAGNAYHAALDYYFSLKKKGTQIDLVEMEQAAFQYLESVGANKWKLQKTTPTVEACQLDALKTVTALLKNFWREKGLYEDELEEVLFVELYGDEFVTVNGVGIPLPLHFKMDLGLKLKDGRIVLVDHKSKKAYTPENEATLTIGIQAISYVLGYESKTGQTVDEVWFVENKFSQNQNGSPQLIKLAVEITPNTRRLYEALLYEPLKRMIDAVRDPNYIYLINDADKYVDMAELYDFWARTMISEVSVDDFNVEEAKKGMVAKRLKKIRDASIEMINPAVIRNFKLNADKFIQYDLSDKNMNHEQKIEHVLRTFKVLAKVAHTFEGYSSNTHLLEVSAGVKVSSIQSYKLDIANALNVSNVRISKEMVVHEGRSYLGIEYAKKRTKDLLYNPADLQGFKIPVGKDNYGNTVVWDLNNHSTPHALVCGATGSGKSVFINSTIAFALEAGVDEVYIFDPKYEFTDLHDHMRVFVYNDITEIEEQVANLVLEMEGLVRTRRTKKILVVFDEYADAISNCRKGSDLDIYEEEEVDQSVIGMVKTKKKFVGQKKPLPENMQLLLQKGRSSGFRIMAAAQRASVKVITGDAKVNFPVQICFRVPKAADSMVVIDEPGAEGLAGQGDGLMRSPEYNDIVRFQAYFKA